MFEYPNFDADVSCQYVPDVIAPAGSDVVASNCAKSMLLLIHKRYLIRQDIDKPLKDHIH